SLPSTNESKAAPDRRPRGMACCDLASRTEQTRLITPSGTAELAASAKPILSLLFRGFRRSLRRAALRGCFFGRFSARLRFGLFLLCCFPLRRSEGSTGSEQVECFVE